MSQQRPFLSLFGICFALVWGAAVWWLIYQSIDQRRLTAFANAVRDAGGYIPHYHPRRTQLEQFIGDLYPRDRIKVYDDVDVVDLRLAKNPEVLLSDIAAAQQLTCVKIGSTLHDPAALRHLTELPKLTDLVIDAPQADDRWFEVLSECKGLRRLSVCRGTFSDRSLDRFAKLANMAIVSIPDSAVTDAGIAHLASATSLELLDIRGTATTDAAATTLAPLTKLRQVVIWRSDITPEGAAQLRANHPERFIW